MRRVLVWQALQRCGPSDGEVVSSNALGESLQRSDRDFRRMSFGDAVHVVFDLPSGAKDIALVAWGYDVPL